MDLAFHHAATRHRAEGNRSSSRSRRALGFIYYSTRAVESLDKKRYQEELSKEMKEAGRL
jgi:phytanoyl-CoA hydroxylase